MNLLLTTQSTPIYSFDGVTCVACFHASAAYGMKCYHLYNQRECDEAYDSTRVQPCGTFKVSAVAHDAVKTVNGPLICTVARVCILL